MSNDGIARMLHLAGLDQLDAARDPQVAAGFDPPNVITNSLDEAQARQHEHLPQLGPPFVAFVHDRLTRLERLMIESLKRWEWTPQTIVLIASMNSDASGNINRGNSPGSAFIEPPPGFTIALHRLSISITGNNFGTPFNAAAAYWELRIDEAMADGGSLVANAGSFPVVRTWGTRDAIHVRDGEVGSLFVSGMGAAKTLTVLAQATLKRQAEA